MDINLIKLLQECPETTVKVKVTDLVEANRTLVNETIEEYEKKRKELEYGEMMSAREVEVYLGISKTTRERWGKPEEENGEAYLPKIKVGWQVRYLKSDVEKVKVREDALYGKK